MPPLPPCTGVRGSPHSRIYFYSPIYLYFGSTPIFPYLSRPRIFNSHLSASFLAGLIRLEKISLSRNPSSVEIVFFLLFFFLSPRIFLREIAFFSLLFARVRFFSLLSSQSVMYFSRIGKKKERKRETIRTIVIARIATISQRLFEGTTTHLTAEKADSTPRLNAAKFAKRWNEKRFLAARFSRERNPR